MDLYKTIFSFEIHVNMNMMHVAIFITGPSSEDAKYVQEDEIVYDGDAETSSSESNIENSDSEGDMKTVFCKGKGQLGSTNSSRSR